jgi:heptosyltransferase-2
MKAVRDRCPEARITLLVRPWVAGLFDHAPFIDDVWTRPRPGAASWIQTAREMRRREFDLAILLPNSFESALTAYLGGVPARAGYSTDHRGWLLNPRIDVPEPHLHQTEYYLRLIDEVLGPGDRPSIDIEASPGERRAAGALLEARGVDPARGYVVLSPGAAFGSAKRWFEDRFAEASDRLSDALGATVVIIGSAAEREVGERIRQMMASTAHNLCGETHLPTLVGLLAGASVVVTNDSGPMHMAAALGRPTVAVFGSTDATVTHPVGPRTRVVRHDVDCSPCMLRECPIDHRCMSAVTVNEVVEAALELAGAHGNEP